MQLQTHKPVIIWLTFCAALVFAMVVVGGLTRLTESGLSIVEWKPLHGTLPPLSHDAWMEEFDAYKTSPQYLKVNKGMSLEEFKGIFWLEFIHRLLGRMVGIVFFIPLFYFAIRKSIDRPLTLKLAGIFLLGGLQGVVGWYMVKSGLSDEPRVSPYRLTFHLGLAVIIYGLIVWNLFNLKPQHPTPDTTLHRGSVFITLLIFIQILLGALVAGNDAGLTYNTFPLMDSKWVPDGLWIMAPAHLNFFENVTMVQFQHRLLAYVLVVLIPLFCLFGLRRLQYSTLSPVFCGMIIVLILQFLLGILTLIMVVPTLIASMHQAVAMILFTLALLLMHRTRPIQ